MEHCAWLVGWSVDHFGNAKSLLLPKMVQQPNLRITEEKDLKLSSDKSDQGKQSTKALCLELTVIWSLRQHETYFRITNQFRSGAASLVCRPQLQHTLCTLMLNSADSGF